MRQALLSRLALVAFLIVEHSSAGAPAAPEPASGDEGRGVPARLVEGQDAYFAANHFTSTSLLHLRADGTFAQYNREHMFVAISDEGRWRQGATGDIEMCSHYSFTPIRVGGFSLYIRPEEAAGLPALAAALEARLSALPGQKDLALQQLMPVVVRWWRADDAFGPLPAGGLAPDIMSEEKLVSRDALRSLASAIRGYVAKRSGNLSTRVVGRHDDLMWLSDDDQPVDLEVVKEYRKWKEERKTTQGGPFLPGATTVAVDADAFASLLGTRQSFIYYPEMNVRIPRRDLLHDFGRTRVREPQCGDFTAGAIALPDPPAAVEATLPQGEDVGFVAEGGSGMSLLVLGADGSFSRHEGPEDGKAAQTSDAGQWKLGSDSVLRLCSSSAFRPIEHERLQLSVDEAVYAKLPALLAGLQAHLKAKPKEVSFRPKAIEGIAARTLPTERSGAKGCSCRILVYGDEPVAREEVLAFISTLDEYLRSGAANLVEQKLWSFGTTTWLGKPDGKSNADVVRTLRTFGERPCVLPGVLVRVPLTTVPALRGSASGERPLPGPTGTPLCAGSAP
jgi:hypothetical protein